jgi:alpha-methylacyl-CoA racemase
MLLSDMGADVVRIERPNAALPAPTDITARGRTLIRADLKRPADRDRILTLLAQSEVLIEGFRPGVMERLGLGPRDVFAKNARLIYGRMTGWGQDGPLALTAGHDINYISITGSLNAIGPAGGPPVPPLNLVGDYGGGSLFLVTGILAALTEARVSGRGQVVDAAITDGAIALMSAAIGQHQRGVFHDRRGSNLLDGGGTPWYGVYETADGGYISVGPIEPQFFAELCEMIALPQELRDAQHDRSRHPQLRAELSRIFRTRTRDEWASMAATRDACLAPILTIGETMNHPHNIARSAFVELKGVKHPSPAPRFSLTPSKIQGPPATEATSLEAVLASWSDDLPKDGAAR